jgi:hypothetical protein
VLVALCKQRINKPRPFEETGKGQHRGAKAAPNENAGRSQTQSTVPMCRLSRRVFLFLFSSIGQHLNKSRVEQRQHRLFERGGGAETVEERARE